MNITEVRVFPVNEDRLKAYVNMVFDNSFVVRDIKVIDGKNGLFIAFPSKKDKQGKFKDICHPLNQGARIFIQDMVFEAYKKEVGDMASVLNREGEEKA